MTKLSVSLHEAEAISGLSSVTLRRMAKRGKLKVARIGRRIVIPMRELEKLLRPGAVSETGRKKE
jgi:Helix-turn-helix domain